MWWHKAGEQTKRCVQSVQVCAKIDFACMPCCFYVQVCRCVCGVRKRRRGEGCRCKLEGGGGGLMEREPLMCKKSLKPTVMREREGGSQEGEGKSLSGKGMQQCWHMPPCPCLPEAPWSRRHGGLPAPRHSACSPPGPPGRVMLPRRQQCLPLPSLWPALSPSSHPPVSTHQSNGVQIYSGSRNTSKAAKVCSLGQLDQESS